MAGDMYKILDVIIKTGGLEFNQANPLVHA